MTIYAARHGLREDRRTTAKRIRRLLLPLVRPVSPRTVRRFVAALRRALAPKEAFVHRSVLPVTTMEVDFGESWVDIAGAPCKVKCLVATLPYSNVYFAKAYPVERIESLLDGIESALRYLGAWWTGSSSTTPPWRSRTCWPAGTGCRDGASAGRPPALRKRSAGCHSLGTGCGRNDDITLHRGSHIAGADLAGRTRRSRRAGRRVARRARCGDADVVERK